MAAGAILLVLAALLMAVFPRVNVAGKATVNLSNHRQIASALLAYAYDHRGDLPYCYENIGAVSKMTYTRKLVLLGYLDNPRVFFSPLAGKWYEKGGMGALSTPTANSSTPWFYTNYAVNRYGAMPYDASVDGAARRPANLNRVGADGNLAALMLLRDNYDRSYDVPGSADKDRGGGRPWFSGVGYLPPPAKSYHGQIYAAFADGHVQSFSYPEMVLLMEKPKREPPLFNELYTRD